MNKTNFAFYRIFTLIIMLFALLFSVAIVGRKNKLLEDKIRLMEREQQRLVEENKKLVTDISLLSNNDRIETIASQELDMHRATTAQIKRLEIPSSK